MNSKAWIGLVVATAVGLSLPALAEDAAKPAPPAAPAAAAPAPAAAPAATAAPAPAAAPGPAVAPPAAAAPAAAPTPAAVAPAPAGSVGSGWSAEVAPGKAGLTLDDTQKGLVKQVGDYFEGISTLKGAFVQTGADKKRMKGKFYMNRPGRFRFDYSLPSRQVIVSDGKNLAIQDLDLNNEDRVELDKTPFRLLLRKDVNLERDANILEVQAADDLLVLALRDKDPETPGAIKLFMSTRPALELKEWQAVDAQGQETQVQVSELEKGSKLEEKLFVIQPLGPGLSVPQ
jgi:outer membrane lipoprotein-sorting protein